jgi:hypothetical protein
MKKQRSEKGRNFLYPIQKKEDELDCFVEHLTEGKIEGERKR